MKLNITNISTAITGVLCTVSTLSSANSDFESVSSGSRGIVGDFSSASDMQPHVVFNYLATCANINIDVRSCLVKVLIENTFGEKERWNRIECNSPILSAVDLQFALTRGLAECYADKASLTGTNATDTYQNFLNITSNEACWENLCEEEAIFEIEKSWISRCTGSSLQLSPVFVEVDPLEDVDHSNRYDKILTCMVGYAMSSKPSAFGFTDPAQASIENCFPPEYTRMIDICHRYLALPTLEHCSALYDERVEEDYDILMAYNDENAFGRGNGNNNSAENNQILNDFCSLMTRLSAKQNRLCLVDLCENARPSMAPSLGPGTPSILPTQTTLSSTMSSMTPIMTPGATSTITPIVLPSKFSSVTPSIPPTPVLTATPSATSTKEPSRISIGMLRVAPSSVPSKTATLVETSPTPPSIYPTDSIHSEAKKHNIPVLLNATTTEDSYESVRSGVNVHGGDVHGGRSFNLMYDTSGATKDSKFVVGTTIISVSLITWTLLSP